VEGQRAGERYRRQGKDWRDMPCLTPTISLKKLYTLKDFHYRFRMHKRVVDDHIAWCERVPYLLPNDERCSPCLLMSLEMHYDNEDGSIWSFWRFERCASRHV
jgi:hypothetical protein